MAALVETPVAPLLPGTVLGERFRIISQLGAGGMGIVYRARDEQLSRDVAIKMHARGSGAERLMREATAMAQLSHPNVVTIYEVGQHDDSIFIAMELVEGTTARVWRNDHARSWRDVLQIYLPAGDGLVAIHAAGLIHRDFKPDNVLIGDDGRVRVADLGLARTVNEIVTVDSSSTTGSNHDATRTGAVLGTPAYMSPEQLSGAVDARSDQFSFCATLWEALFGTRPFTGSTIAEREAEIDARPETTKVRVPRRIVEALRRGLASSSDARWPTMAELVEELRRVPMSRRRLVAIVASLVATAALATLVVVNRSVDAPPCEDGEIRIASVWNPARVDALQRSLGSAWKALYPHLEARARSWVTTYRDACRATYVAKSQSAEMLDRRMACLGRVRADLDGFLDELGDNASLASGAEIALRNLTPPDACAIEALEAQTPPPTDPGATVLIENAARVLARASAAVSANHMKRAMKLALDGLVLARAGRWRSQIGHARGVQAVAFYEAGRIEDSIAASNEAIAIALAERNDDMAVREMSQLATELGSIKADEARRVLSIARALWERGDRSPKTGWILLGSEAELALDAGRIKEALAAGREQARLAADAGVSTILDAGNLATYLFAASEYVEAVEILERALARDTLAFGEGNAAQLAVLPVLARCKLALGDVDAALAYARRAVEIADHDGRPIDGPTAYGVYGDVLRISGDLEGAKHAMVAAFELEKRLATTSRSSELAQAEHNIAMVEVALGNLDEAGRRGRSALATLEKLYGLEHPLLINALQLVAHVARETGDLATSERQLRRAIAIGDREYGPGTENPSNSRVELSKTLVGMKRAAEAVELLQPIVASGGGLTPPGVAEATFELARAVRATGKDRERARTLAADARRRYVELGEPFAPNVDAIDAWSKSR